MSNNKKNNIFIKEAYSENASLKIFLNSLSYHKVGAPFFSDQINMLCSREPLDMLDVGCGNGQFTAELLANLKGKYISPFNITAIDPDVDNLNCYKQKLLIFPEVSVFTSTRGVETLPKGKWLIVMSSHSLYQFMENPEINDSEKSKILKCLIQRVKQGGVLLISMASIHSQAYKFKINLLEALGFIDYSVFGEDIVERFKDLEIQISHTLHDSYMDVTKLINLGSIDLLNWSRYFCRLSNEQVQQIGLDKIRNFLLKFVIRFSEIPHSLAQFYASAPAPIGAPHSDSIILPHKECFIVVQL